MSYNIKKSNGEIITILDNGVDYDQTTIGLIGRNTVNYGFAENERVLRILENFAALDPPGVNTHVPGTPITGQLWFDTANLNLKIFNGNAWQAVTVSGSSDLIPSGDVVASLGTPTLRWHDLHAAHGIFDSTNDSTPGDAYSGIAISAKGNVTTTGNIYPVTTNTGSLGTSTNTFSASFVRAANVTNTLKFGTTGATLIQRDASSDAIIPSGGSGAVALGTTGSRFNAVLDSTNINTLTNNNGTISLAASIDIVPATTNTSCLGSPTSIYEAVYAKDLYENNIKLSDKYITKTADSTINSNLILSNGTTNTPELVFNVPANTPGDADGGFAYIDMNLGLLRAVGYTTGPYPGLTPNSPRILATMDISNGELIFSNVSTGGIVLPNNVAFSSKDVAGINKRGILKINSLNNVEVGNSGHMTLLVGSSKTGLEFTDGTSRWQVYHAGNLPNFGVEDKVSKAGDTMTGTLESTANTILSSELTSSDGLFSFNNGAILHTVNDGSSLYAIKTGVGTAGVSDTYLTTNQGASRIKLNMLEDPNGGTVVIQTAPKGTQGNTINWSGTNEFTTTLVEGKQYNIFNFSSKVDNLDYRSRLFSRLKGTKAYTVLQNLNRSGAVQLITENVNGVEKYCTLHGQTDGTSVKTEGELHVTGDVVAFASDKRLKTNILPIKDPIEKIKKLNGVTYEFNELAKSAGLSAIGRFSGVFAQDVEEVLPEAVRLAPFDTGSDGESISNENYKTVQYEQLIPLLIEAIKNQQAQIDKLKMEIGLIK